VARCLIVGCGCRGLALARELHLRGHRVRGTTRDPARATQLEAANVEPVVGDPDRIASLSQALAHTGVACLLLGSAAGGDEAIRALHGPRLAMLLERTIDTTVRGVVYEATGTVDPEVLRSGAELVKRACRRSSIGFELLSADPRDHAGWPALAADAVERVLLG